jgi:hypothetical protein
MIAAFDCGRHFMGRSDILLLGFAERGAVKFTVNVKPFTE